MLKPLYTAPAVALLLPLVFASSLFAKPKDASLPIFILHARTVLVIIDPSAGVSVDDPRANEIARKDVETALLKWGRFQLALSGMAPDLTIVVRKGSGKLADATVSNPQQNNRHGDITTTDDSISVGARRGTPPPTSSTEIYPSPTAPSAHPQVESGGGEDSFFVYEGSSGENLDGAVGWRYVAKNALHSHDVPAVDAFRKAIDEAEKAAAKQQGKTPPASQPAQPQPPAPQPHP
jgi:hypothetical protein